MPAISCQIKLGVAQLTLDNPNTGNAMGWEFWQTFQSTIEELDQNPDVRVVLIHGSGKHFSAGLDLNFAREAFGDISHYDARQVDALSKFVEKLQDAFLAVEKMDKPVIAAIHGACIGGALELACSADIRLCSKEAFFALKEIQLGIIPDLGGLQRLNKLLPQGIARELTYTGRQFNASEALDWGLVNRVLKSPEELLEAGFTLASEIAQQTPLALKWAKRAFVDKDRRELERELRPMALTQVTLCMQGDMQTAIYAMQSKQPPQFENLKLPPTLKK